MKYFAKNIQFLREKKGLKQAEMLSVLGFNQSTWNNYEKNVSVPSIRDLVKISKYFDISETDILNENLSKRGNLILEDPGAEFVKKGKLKGKEKGNLTIKNSTLEMIKERLGGVSDESGIYFRMPHVVTVDQAGNDNVVMVPVRARAGYLSGYSDPQFIEKLPSYRLPGLSNGTYRLFEVGGLSMYPTLHSGDLLIGSFVEQLRDLRDDRVHVVVTKNDGLVVKRVLNRIQKDGKLILKSDNYKDRDQFPTIVCDPEDVLEIWYATGSISRQLRPPEENYKRLVDLEGRFTLLEDSFKKLLPK